MNATTMTVRLGAALVLVVAATAATAATSGAAEPTPHFNTGSISHVRGTTGQINGSVVPSGLATSYAFEYGPTAEPHGPLFPNKTKPVAVPLPTAPVTSVKVGQTVSGLLAGYHYRIVGFYTNAKGEAKTEYGREKTFSNTSANALKFTSTKGGKKHISVVYGGSAELTGSLKGAGNAGHAITLQATPFPFTSPFTAVPGTVLTNRLGSFMFKVPHLTQSTEFRFGTVDPRPVLGEPVTVGVTPRITLHWRRGGKTRLYRFYGTTTPALNGASVTVQQLLPQKAGSEKEGPRPRSAGSTVLKRRSATSSRFSVIVKLAGTFHYRVNVKPPKGPLDSGNSSNVLIKAPAAPRKKTKK